MFHQNLLWSSSLCLVYGSYEQVAYPYGWRSFFASRRLHWITMLFHRVIMSSCHLVNHFIVSSFMSSSHRVIILSCHHFIMSSCHHLCHHCIMSSCYSVIVSSFLAMFGNNWQLLPTSANFQQHHPTFFNCWLHLGIFVNFCQCQLETFGNFWLLVAMIGYFLYLLATFSNVWQYLAKFDSVCQFWHFCHNWQLLAAFGNFCHLVVLSSSCLVIQSSCHPVILSSCHLDIFTSCHFVLLLSFQPGSLSICQLVVLLACDLLSLWAFQLAHLGACQLVSHIKSMISFGGFLAECLPCSVPEM